MKLHWRDFFFLGLSMVGNGGRVDRGATPTLNQKRHFKSQFGVSWFICEDLWNLLDDHKENQSREAKHLLWALLFLKVYGNESTYSRIAGTLSKTFRICFVLMNITKYFLLMIKSIVLLKL